MTSTENTPVSRLIETLQFIPRRPLELPTMRGIVRQITDGPVVIESSDGDNLLFEPSGADGFRPLDLVAWADGPEIFNWSQNKHDDGRWVAGDS